MKRQIKTILGVVGMYAAARSALRLWKQSRYPLRGRVIVITGGSRGLGLLLAREYARRGSKLVLIARDAPVLERACEELRAAGAEVLGLPGDVGDEAQAQAIVERTVLEYGRIDVLINAAGRIEVGPLPSMTAADFRNTMNTNFWGAFNMSRAALPHLLPSQSRIVNISSIGGLLSVPHLLPYSASKFALTGFSLGLRMELAEKGIPVVTVCPGLMRTGSPWNALFKGDRAAEYAWFSVADSLPLFSINARRAALAILRASQRGDVRLVLGATAKLAALAQALFPSTMVRLSTTVNRLLPHSTDTTLARGADVERRVPGWLTASTDRAAERNNELE